MNELPQNILKQEKELQFDHFSNEDAIELGLILYNMAKKESLPVTIDIIRSGQQLFHIAMPGTSPDNDIWISRKVKLVNRVLHSSYYVNRYLANINASLEEVYELNHFDYACHGGCFPITIKGTGMVGTVTVSGLEQSKDHELAVRAITKFLKKD